MDIIFERGSVRTYWLNKICEELFYAKSAVINLDFKNDPFFSPFSLIFIISCVKTFRKNNPRSKLIITPPSYSPCSPYGWVERMGFISCLNEIFNQDHNEIIPSNNDNCLPIEMKKLSEFISYDKFSREDMNESILIKSDDLTRILTHLDKGPAFDILRYSVREIIRNVYEHSNSSTITICAQYWKDKNKVQMVIFDYGIGISNSLKFNPAYKNISPIELLKLACLPGVSGNARDIRNKSQTNKWQNSGYGLYMTSSICKNDGDFYVISNEDAIFIKGKERAYYKIKGFRGTLIRMTLCLDDLENFNAKFQKYIQTAKNIAAHINGAKMVDASFASQMLTL